MMMVVMVREERREKGFRVSGLGRVWNDVLCWFGMDRGFLVWMLLCFDDALSLSGVSFDGQVRRLPCVLLGTRRKCCGDWFEQGMFYKAAGHIHSHALTIHLHVGRVATAFSTSALTPTSGKYV
jgi:hypothetical protein